MCVCVGYCVLCECVCLFVCGMGVIGDLMSGSHVRHPWYRSCPHGYTSGGYAESCWTQFHWGSGVTAVLSSWVYSSLLDI